MECEGVIWGVKEKDGALRSRMMERGGVGRSVKD